MAKTASLHPQPPEPSTSSKSSEFRDSLIPTPQSSSATGPSVSRFKEALKSMLIIPRTPTPPPLQEREYDSIDRQDVLELQRQLKAMKEKHKLRNVKVKRERTDDNPRRRKVARSSRHSTQLELDEEGGVRESATPTLAEREIIELD
ncbi:hypothetical protein LTS00_017413 [Friedmanniomyces endolithicus]|uniref:Uncharacterized protein n=1 Tax=Friedmanniomyces endolithicus TaxID=329885 RepID=A0AAN6FWE8_9PEZI|nr:hypothetical protein LTS00_017413 [Friedmanniomyces endolithicus]KAK0324089.1 hypothetical protein LTR82_005210 [Friedmanniomyces endolithicus]